MKLITYLNNGKEEVGVLSLKGDKIYPVKALGLNYNSMNELIDNISENEKKLIYKTLNEESCRWVLDYSSVKRLAPIPEPKQDIICLGINYWAHAEESMRYKKESFESDRHCSIYFSKRVNRALADGEEIISHSDIIDTLDYEAELAVIIGEDAAKVSREDAYKYVFGYTIINDVTARQLQTSHKQWYFGKSLDGCTPMGPMIVTADEIGEPPVLKITSTVNGELRQNGTTDMLIYDIPYIISELSQGMTLKSGIIIATGTPAGVGMGFTPPKFLKSGDVVECAIEKIGSITNKVK